MEINQHRYLIAAMNLDPALKIYLLSALNVDHQIDLQQSLSRTLLVGLFFIVLIVSALAIWQSDRISRPIVSLADAAANFRQGHLEGTMLWPDAIGRTLPQSHHRVSVAADPEKGEAASSARMRVTARGIDLTPDGKL